MTPARDRSEPDELDLDFDLERIDSILVPTDGSPAAGEALERAILIADAADDDGPDRPIVHVLSVVDATSDPLRFGAAEVADLERAKWRLVEDVVATVDSRDCEVRPAVRRGRPASTILSYAADNDVDLLVVGRTGRGNIERTLLGSVTDRLLRRSPIPVLVVPAPS
ncbi:universal stress protein UspA [Halobiforma lacisalsi AJ5]|uniref:Universal stress protein UspA n=1 Tax=Natronobacterium lacisalsi AJ5 TaxID=358396 RepID=M0LIC9_NATLA|nr:universal stress protein [Halobiforma lacisalsi]APW98499.1 universal stress protein UspA [Halobiforma lacisalsi AJ5]EMA33281.1 UspA domain-containing protein [Halobiforma lacisalsi AJ5]